MGRGVRWSPLFCLLLLFHFVSRAGRRDSHPCASSPRRSEGSRGSLPLASNSSQEVGTRHKLRAWVPRKTDRGTSRERSQCKTLPGRDSPLASTRRHTPHRARRIRQYKQSSTTKPCNWHLNWRREQERYQYLPFRLRRWESRRRRTERLSRQPTAHRASGRRGSRVESWRRRPWPETSHPRASCEGWAGCSKCEPRYRMSDCKFVG